LSVLMMLVIISPEVSQLPQLIPEIATLIIKGKLISIT